MTNMKPFRDFIVDKEYTLHVVGFNEPVIGRVIKIEVAEDQQALLVMLKTDDSTPVKIFVKAISGWSENTKAA